MNILDRDFLANLTTDAAWDLFGSIEFSDYPAYVGDALWDRMHGR